MKVSVLPGVTTWWHGDSYGLGIYDTIASGIAARSALLSGTILSNQSQNGRASFAAVEMSFTNGPRWNRTRDLAVWMASFNDACRGGTDARTPLKIAAGLRAWIVNYFLKSAVPASHGSVVSTGWAGGTGICDKASLQLGGTIMTSNTVGATQVFQFYGDDVEVGIFNTDGTTYPGAVVEYSVDGATSGSRYALHDSNGKCDGISDSVNNNQRCHDAIRLTGCGDIGPHTLTAKVISVSPGGYAYHDYFGRMNIPARCGPMIVFVTPRLDRVAGYAAEGRYATPAVMDAADAAIRSVVAEFANYPVVIAETNRYVDTESMFNADHRHWNGEGHHAGALAFADCIEVRPNATGCRVSDTANQSIPHGTVTPVTFATAEYDDEGFHGTTHFKFDYDCCAEFMGSISFAPQAVDCSVAIGYLQNGAFVRWVSFGPASLAAQAQGTVVEFMFEASVARGGDVEIVAWQNSGVALNVTNRIARMRIVR